MENEKDIEKKDDEFKRGYDTAAEKYQTAIVVAAIALFIGYKLGKK